MKACHLAPHLLESASRAGKEVLVGETMIKAGYTDDFYRKSSWELSITA